MAGSESSEERPGESTGGGAALVTVGSLGYWRCQGHGIVTNGNDRYAISQPQPMRQTVCTVGGRAGQVQLLKPFEAKKITSEIQMPDTELTPLDWGVCFDLVLIVHLFFPLRITVCNFF